MKIRKLIICVGVVMFAAVVVVWLWLPARQERNRIIFTLMTLNNVATASQSYFTEYGVWPRTMSELTSTNNPKQIIFLAASRTPLADGWGNPLMYVPHTLTNKSGAVQSHGRDGAGRQVLYEVKF